MENSSAHINLILLIAGSLIPVLGVLIWCLVDIINRKWLRLIWLKLALFALCAVIILFSTPWIFLNSALTFSKDKVMCEAFLKGALKTSVLSSVKSDMYLYLAQLYYFDHRGQDAIDAFEQSYKYKHNDTAVDNLCSLYTIKGQRSYAVAACLTGNHNETAAINSILKDDYEMAYNSINTVIKTSKNPSCLAYAIRGHVYRYTGVMEMFEADFNKARVLCPNAPNIEEIYNNKHYFHQHYDELKKEYNFK